MEVKNESLKILTPVARNSTFSTGGQFPKQQFCKSIIQCASNMAEMSIV